MKEKKTNKRWGFVGDVFPQSGGRTRRSTGAKEFHRSQCEFLIRNYPPNIQTSKANYSIGCWFVGNVEELSPPGSSPPPAHADWGNESSAKGGGAERPVCISLV